MAKTAQKPSSNHIGVVGAGTMGSGIALAALLADLRVTLYDVDPAGLERARDYIEKFLQRKQRLISIKYLSLTSDLEAMASAAFVIEAAPEILVLKQELFLRLEAICAPSTILATNTSTLPVTAIGGAIQTPERVAGLHFFNPAPVLPLVEVVRGARSSTQTIHALVELARRMGKTPVVAGDTPGFIVNRVARPFYGEALRLLGENAASPAQIDQIVRQGGGFRMGPFELMDLIGIDINFAATQSMYEQSFGEPRYRPHLIQAQMVQQNALGRKTSRGFYTYPDGEPSEKITPHLPPAQALSQVLISPGTYAPGLVELIENASGGLALLDTVGDAPDHGSNQPVIGIQTAGRAEGAPELLVQLDLQTPAGLPLLAQASDITVAEMSTYVRNPHRLVGFDGLFLANSSLVTLVAGPGLSPEMRAAAEAFFAALQREPVWVADTPALVLPRIVCMLANEAAFAAGESVAEPAVIDQAMQLGTNYPKGPLAWAEQIGYPQVASVINHLQSEYGEDRYRLAPLLRRWARNATAQV